MRLADVIHEETGVPLDQIILLRHFDNIERLVELGGSVEEFTSLQPINTKWDFWRDGKPQAKIVAVIVHNRVFGIYKIIGIESEGTFESLASTAHCKFNIERDVWKPDQIERRFSMILIPSITSGQVVTGWAGKEIVAIIRNNAPLFSAIQVDLPINAVTLSDQDAVWEPSTDEEYSPQQNSDSRVIVERQIRERRGQQQFRDALRVRYGDYCLVTGCGVLAVLEAAHIKPYRGEDDHHPANGLLLRADIHTLFDLDLLGIRPDCLLIELHPTIINNDQYGNLAGKTLRCPSQQRPSDIALQVRYNQFLNKIQQSL